MLKLWASRCTSWRLRQTRSTCCVRPMRVRCWSLTCRKRDRRRLSSPPPVKMTRVSFDSAVRAVCVSPDGALCAAATTDGYVHVHSLSQSELPVTWRTAAHRDWIHALAFASDSRRLASASADNTVKVWSVAGKGKRDATAADGVAGDGAVPLCETRGHTDGVVGIVWLNKNQFATASADGSCRLFGSLNGDEMTAGKINSRAPLRPIFFVLVCAHCLSLVRLSFAAAVRPHNDQPLLDVAALGDEPGCVVTLGADGELCALDLLALRPVLRVRHARDPRAAFVRAASASESAASSAAAEAGALVATCARGDAFLRLWMAPLADDAFSPEGEAAARELARQRVHEGAVLGVAVRPDGAAVASVGVDGMVNVLPIKGSGRHVRWAHARDTTQPRSVRACAWNADGSLVLTGGSDGVGTHYFVFCLQSFT